MSIKDAITFKNIFSIFKFLNVVDDRTGELSPPKILAWAISIGIIAVMFQINKEQVDLTIFAGALMTLVTAFGIVWKIGQGEKVKLRLEQENDYQPYGIKPEEDDVVKP